MRLFIGWTKDDDGNALAAIVEAPTEMTAWRLLAGRFDLEGFPGPDRIEPIPQLGEPGVRWTERQRQTV